MRPQLHGSSAMIDVDIVRKVALSLPEVEDRSTQSGLKFYVRGKQFAWTISIASRRKVRGAETGRARRPLRG